MNRPSLFRTHAMGGVSIASFKTGSILSTAGLLMSLAIAPPSIAQTIETVAGTGVYGYNGEDIPALKAELFQPTYVAFDSAGNLFFSPGRQSVGQQGRCTDRHYSYGRGRLLRHICVHFWR